MARKAKSTQDTVDQYSCLLEAIRENDTRRVKKLWRDLPGEHAHGFTGQVLSGEFPVPDPWVQWLVDSLPPPPAGDQGYVMTTALLSNHLDVLHALSKRGFDLPRSDLVADAMVRAMAQGRWPHAELLWPDVIDCNNNHGPWMRLLSPSSTTEDNPFPGLDVKHLARINGLSHVQRPPIGFSSALASLGWEGDAAVQRFQGNAKHVQALGWLAANGWIDREAIYFHGTKNTQWILYMDKFLDFVNAQGQAEVLEGQTQPSLGVRSSPRL